VTTYSEFAMAEKCFAENLHQGPFYLGPGLKKGGHWSRGHGRPATVDIRINYILAEVGCIVGLKPYHS
jgi:hypothetical protein